jgi:chromosome segregation ATPase
MPENDPELLRKVKLLEARLEKAQSMNEAQKKDLDSSALIMKEKDTRISQLQSEVSALTQKNTELSNSLNDPELQKKLKALEVKLEKAQSSYEVQEKKLNSSLSIINEKESTISKLQSEISVLAQKNFELLQNPDISTKERPMIKFEELARQFQGSVSALNSEAKQKSKGGDEHLVIDQFEIEIKGGLDLKDGIRLTQLQGSELSPESVSTIRFALRQVPVISIIDEEKTDK